MLNHRGMSPVEQIAGYTFRKPRLLVEALTHASLAYETQKPQADNQRLEFLGDAVLQLALSHELFLRFGDADEGVLTKARAQLVSTKALARLSRHLRLGAHIRMGRGEEANGGRDRDNILADVFEALIGAIYVDGGLESARDFVLRSYADDLESITLATLELNAKGHLQELIQATAGSPPTYHIVASVGPDHQKSFEAAVTWLGVELGRGTGRSKKEAEMAAARVALDNPELHRRLHPSVPAALPTSCEKGQQQLSQS